MAFNFPNSSTSPGGQLHYNNCSTGVPQNPFQQFGIAQTSPFIVTNPIQSVGGGQPASWPFGTSQSQGHSPFPSLFPTQGHGSTIFGGQGQQAGTNTSFFGGQSQQQGTNPSLFGGPGQQQFTSTSVFGGQGQPQGPATSMFGGQAQQQGTGTFPFGCQGQQQSTSPLGGQSMHQGQNALPFQTQAQAPFSGFGQSPAGFFSVQPQGLSQQTPPKTSFDPNGFTQTSFHSGHGQSTMAMGHLNNVAIGRPPPSTVAGPGAGGSQDFFRNLKWPEPRHPGQGQNSNASIATGQFTLVDTGVLTKLLQAQTTSAPEIPAAKPRPRSRLEEIRSDISDLHYSTPGTAVQYPSMFNRSNSARFLETKQSFSQRPSRPPPLEDPQSTCSQEEKYYVECVPDVGQFRPQAQAKQGVVRQASWKRLDDHCRQPSPQIDQPLGHRLSFKPPPIDTNPANWKKLNLKSLDSGTNESKDFRMPLTDKRRTFNDKGCLFHNPNKKLTEASPPRVGCSSSFANLVQARVGVPVPRAIRNLSFRPQPQEVVANLSHRVSGQYIPAFSPFFPSERNRFPRPCDPSNLRPEVKELLRKDNLRIPVVAPPSSDLSSNDDWSFLIQKRPSNSNVRAVTTLEDDGSSILEKAVATKKSLDPEAGGNKTRSRRARSGMTCATQEKNRCRVILSRDQYYCRPDIASLDAITDDDGHCLVTNFEVGHFQWGKVVFEGTFDVAGINLDTSIDIVHKAVILHKGTEAFPSLGRGLNRSATVTLTNVWYNNPVTKMEVRDPSKLKAMKFDQILKDINASQDAVFISYDPTKGEWVYKVKNFLNIVTLPPVTRRETFVQEEQEELGIIPEETYSSIFV